MRELSGVALLLFLSVTGGIFAAGKHLPEIAVALSPGNYETEIAQLTRMPIGVREIVLPILPIRPGEKLILAPGDYEKITAILSRNTPSMNRVWLHLKLLQAAPGKPAEEIKQAVTDLVDELVKQLAFPYKGVILEAEAGCSPNLLRLTAFSLSVALKASRENIQFAVSTEIAAQVGEKILAYIDSLVCIDSSNHSFLKEELSRLQFDLPISYFNDAGETAVRDSLQFYLDSVIAVSQLKPGLIFFENARYETLNDLLMLSERLKIYLPSQMIRVQDVPGSSRLLDDREVLPAQAVFVDVPGRVVILSRVDGAPDKPRKLRFIDSREEPYRLKLFDPLHIHGDGEKPGMKASGEFDWPGEYILLVADSLGNDEEEVTDSISVTARVGLSVEEIVARWQRYDKAQKRKIKNYTAKTIMDMHFVPPGLDAGFDVSLHFEYYWKNDGTQYWKQEAQYLNGIKFSNKRSFPLPQLEPEKVVSQPLELNLVESYRYHLEKNETVKGTPCYVLSFRPRNEIEAKLYTGAIWIDSLTFRKVRVLLVQNNCAGSILSNRELQSFEILEGEGGNYNLMVQNDVEQKILAAGREFTLQRRYVFKDIAVNSGTFDEQLKLALDSELPMFTETQNGLRELALKKDGRREVKEKVDTFVWALVAGLLYDGTVTFPVPLIGATMMDYDFLGSDMQLSAMLVLPVLALNLTKQSGRNLTFGSDLFLSAIPRNDRTYRDGAAVDAEAVYIFSESFGFRLGWQPVTALSINASSYLIYEHWFPQENTDDAFELPRSGFTLNPNLSLEYSREGYRFRLSASLFHRLGWQEWGLPGSDEPLSSTYIQAYCTIGKLFYIGSFTRVGIELGYYTGWNRDRFASYQPSMLSIPQIRGVPSGTVSLEDIGVLSLNAGFTVFDFVRIDAYYNFARGETSSIEGTGRLLDFQGIELDWGTIGPWKSYIQARIAYAAAGPLERYNSRWSLYIMMFLPFK